jgi:DNA excision repair protein ERCC-2
MRGYANVLIDLSNVVPDGIVCFFVSYELLEKTVATWVDQVHSFI